MVTLLTEAETTAITSRPADSEWLLDADLTRRELRTFQQVGEEAVKQSDDSLLNVWFARIVKRWPYKSDPSEPDSYEYLKLSEFKEVSTRVQAAFQAILKD